MIQNHGNVHVYVRTDNCVIRNIGCLEKIPKIFRVILLGVDNAKLTLNIAGQEPLEEDFSQEFSIIPHLKDFVSGEIHITIKLSNGLDYGFHIAIAKIPELNTEPIDTAALKYLFLPLNQNTEPIWSEFSDRFLVPGLNIMDSQYACGLHDYALGFQMISCGKEGRNHIEESFSHLSPFGTPFAITACRVLALRMNCFKLFRKCGATSRFNVVNLFFNNQDAKFDISNNFTGKKWENQEYGVYIDNYTEIFLGALNAYYGNDYGVLDELCLKLNESLNDADRNNRDKLTLLQARIAYKKKDELTFQRLYELLLNHPDFGIEAKEMLS